jgi:hypothetical protein
MSWSVELLVLDAARSEAEVDEESMRIGVAQGSALGIGLAMIVLVACK